MLFQDLQNTGWLSVWEGHGVSGLGEYGMVEDMGNTGRLKSGKDMMLQYLGGFRMVEDLGRRWCFRIWEIQCS